MRPAPRLVLLAPLVLEATVTAASDSASSIDASALAHLFDPLIATKLEQTYAAQPSVPSVYPEYTARDTGAWRYFAADTWTSGFLPSTFYALHERAVLCPKLGLDEKAWLSLARSSSTGEIVLEQHNTVDHDVGFLSFPFSEELKVNPLNATAIAAVNAFATDLAALFNPIVNCTRSWSWTDPSLFTVIIDNMMNLEVLFASADLTNNNTLRDIALRHADRTAEEHVRADGSTFHVVDYNWTTGAVIDKHTSQGYSNSSTWSRGQSWGIYGFSNMFARTGLSHYLDTARHLASYWIEHTPATGIIPWDFDAPTGPALADTSAAMIAANGFLLLAQQEQAVSNFTGKEYYQNIAMQLVNTHATNFWAPEWESLLSNGTVNAPALNNLTGIVYGDYYFIRAGNEMVKQGLVYC